MASIGVIRRWACAALLLMITTQVFAADGAPWSVSKSSGEVWISNGDVQAASLKTDESLKPGDTIRTGRTGRVLLVRGDESLMIAPNSIVGLPAESKEGLSTTILQKAGSILLDVEKRNVKHFEVETPTLAAVVKGTQFRISLNAGRTSVDVIRGQVEVSDFKTGQIAQVMPGQKATVLEHGKPGLSLSGSGSFQPIEQGKPRTPSIERVPVPRAGLTAPSQSATMPVRGSENSSRAAVQTKPGTSINPAVQPRSGGVRISAPIGEVKVNFNKVTHGLARDAGAPRGAGRGGENKNTVWNSGSGNNGNNQGSGGNGGGLASGNGASAGSIAAAAAASAGPGNNGNGKGAGNSANGNGHGNGGNGNGHGNGGNGHGNGGNGHGNGGNGNGNGRR